MHPEPHDQAETSAQRKLMAESVRPRLLDLFCGAGGAAMGYHRAGFDVVGVDIKPQPNYLFEFHRADALWYAGLHNLNEHFDAIHASPPCQHYANVTRWRGKRAEHPALIGPIRELLDQTGLPWIIENVRTPELRGDIVLCGARFGLPLRRHRYFETNWSGLVMQPPCYHQDDDYAFDHGSKQTESEYRYAMGCDWMTVKESREAIPPAYTKFIGEQLLQHIRATEREATQPRIASH